MSSQDRGTTPGIAIPPLPRLYGLEGEIPASSLKQAISQLCEILAAHASDRQRVALLLGNSALFAAALLSVFTRQGRAVLLNPHLTAGEVEKAMAVTGASLLLAPTDYPAERELSALRPHLLHEISLSTIGSLKLWHVGDGGAQSTPRNREFVDPLNREFIVQFTSGVSGVPLAVSRSYEQAEDEVANFVARVRLSKDDVIVAAVPLFHSYGLFAGLMASLRAEASLIIMPGFSPADLADVVTRHRPTIFLGVPLMYEVLSRTPSAKAIDFSSFRLLLSAGAPLLAEIAQKFEERFGKNISQLYGSTEAGMISLNFGDGVSASPTSVGVPLKDRHVRIVDADGADVPYGEEGEIILSSPATAKAYLGRPEISAKKFRDGWYFTGDIGRRDTAGYLTITGRKSSFINVGGLKVDPSEVELSILASNEALECAVVGLERPQFGEIIRAYVVLKPAGDLERVRAHCRAHLASFKMPREFHAVGTLPRSATGKVLRKYLIE
ncbi:MAG: AMP-binding protein [Proteobacteria bacterium]|nr:AMP-binding protein [Pseudomonadota bacterium]